MINMFKKYSTRDGREVRIYAADGQKDNPVHGAVLSIEGWDCYTWSARGLYQSSEFSRHDLIETREKHKQMVWVNIYAHQISTHYLNKDLADAYAEIMTMANST